VHVKTFHNVWQGHTNLANWQRYICKLVNTN